MLRQYPINMSAVDSSNAVQVLIPAITEAVKDITPDIFVCSLNSDIFPRMSSPLLSLSASPSYAIYYLFFFFCVTQSHPHLAELVAAMEVVKPNINSAVFLATLWSSIQVTNPSSLLNTLYQHSLGGERGGGRRGTNVYKKATLNLGQTGNGWMGLASFHDQLKFEGDANYGGSSQEFVQKFTARFGESPKPYTAVSYYTFCSSCSLLCFF